MWPFCHDVHNSSQVATPRWLRKIDDTVCIRATVASTIRALACHHSAWVVIIWNSLVEQNNVKGIAAMWIWTDISHLNVVSLRYSLPRCGVRSELLKEGFNHVPLKRWRLYLATLSHSFSIGKLLSGINHDKVQSRLGPLTYFTHNIDCFTM